MQTIQVVKADLTQPEHQQAVLSMVNGYASDPMGDGKPLSQDVKTKLISGLRDHPTTLIMLALRDEEPVGVAVCFRGFSTFAAKPIVNIHDLYVAPSMRGSGLGQLLLESVEQEAKQLGCCKITLEVQENNLRARGVYTAFGFAQAVHVEDAGGALFMSKSLD